MSKRLRAWAAAAVGGVASLGMLSVLSPWLGFAVRLNAASLAAAALLGVPGVTGLLLLRLLFACG